MNKFLIVSVAVVFTLIFVNAVKGDEAADLKVENEKFIEAKKVLTEVITKMKSDYIRNFASLLAKGVTDLEERTQTVLKTEKDALKRKEVIDFATKAYERLIKFIKDIEESMPNGF